MYMSIVWLFIHALFRKKCFNLPARPPYCYCLDTILSWFGIHFRTYVGLEHWRLRYNYIHSIYIDTRHFNNFVKKKLDLDSFKCVLIPVVSCDAGIDVIWRGCEGTRAGDIVTHVLSKDYTMSDQAGRGRAGIILVFGSNYTHVILGDTGGIIKFGHNLYTRAFQIGGIKYSYCCSKLVNKRGFCFNTFLRF